MTHFVNPKDVGDIVAHLVDRQTSKERRSAALAEWQTLAS
jgi:hypothetical protein